MARRLRRDVPARRLAALGGRRIGPHLPLSGGLLKAAEPELPQLVLENSAGVGDGVGSRLEDLVDILEAATTAGLDPERLGFCLDTAHLWGAGYGLDHADGLDRLLTRFDAELGPRYLRMLHLNDSRATRGSQRDRHEHIGAGLIGQRGMTALLTHPRLADVPAYLETPGMDLGYDRVNMDRVRRLIAGRELPRLPARAFTARSARPARGRRPVATAEESERSELEAAVTVPSN